MNMDMEEEFKKMAGPDKLNKLRIWPSVDGQIHKPQNKSKAMCCRFKFNDQIEIMSLLSSVPCWAKSNDKWRRKRTGRSMVFVLDCKSNNTFYVIRW